MATGRLSPRDVPPTRKEQRDPANDAGKLRHGRRAKLLAGLGALALALVGAQLVLAAPPAADFTAPSVLQIGQSGTFTATASDPDGGAITSIEWDFGNNGTIDASGASVQRSFPSAGTKTVRMVATDSTPSVETTEVTHTVRVNARPVASFTATPNPAKIGQSISFDASASSDSDGTIDEYLWDFENDGTVDASGATPEPHSYPTAGQRTVVLQVRDNDGATGSRSTTVSVTNTPPIARIMASPARAQIDQEVTFSGTDSSAEDLSAVDSINTYAWDLDNDGSFDDGAAATAKTRFQSGGNKTVRLRVTDQHDGVGEATFQYPVNAKPVARFIYVAINPPPGQNGVLLDPQQDRQKPIIGQWLAFHSQSTDDVRIAKHEWSDANPPISGPSGLFGDTTADVLHAPYTAAGMKQVALRVTDNEDAVSEPTLDSIATIDVNTRPTADFSYSPPTPVKTDEITFSQAASDPDSGSNGALTFRWDLDGNTSGPNDGFEATGASVKKTLPTGNHPVRLRVQDGGGARKEITKTVQVAETRPTAAFGFAPTFPLPGQSVTFTSASAPTPGQQIAKQEWDFDYDPVSQKFDVDGAGPNPSHAYSTPGTKVVALKVTEAGGGFDIETHTVVVNAPPQASFSAAPGAPVTDDKVTFSSTSADADGPIAQAWDTDNDGQFDDAAGAVATRSFAQPGTYTIRLRVTDDRGASAVSVGAVKVVQRPAQGVLSGRLTALDFTARIAGRTTKRGAKITLLRVRAPKGALVKIRCKGEDCPRRSKRVEMKQDRLRFRKFERDLRAGTKIIIDATLDGFIGRRVVFKIREGKSPKRKDLCIQPGDDRARPCAGA